MLPKIVDIALFCRRRLDLRSFTFNLFLRHNHWFLERFGSSANTSHFDLAELLEQSLKFLRHLRIGFCSLVACGWKICGKETSYRSCFRFDLHKYLTYIYYWYIWECWPISSPPSEFSTLVFHGQRLSKKVTKQKHFLS